MRRSIFRPGKPRVSKPMKTDVRSLGSSDSSSTSSAGSTKKNVTGKNSQKDDRFPLGEGGGGEPGGGVRAPIKKLANPRQTVLHLGGHTNEADPNSGERRQGSETGAPRSPTPGKKVPVLAEEINPSPAAPSSAQDPKMKRAGMPDQMVNMSKPIIRATRGRYMPRLAGVSCMRYV